MSEIVEEKSNQPNRTVVKDLRTGQVYAIIAREEGVCPKTGEVHHFEVIRDPADGRELGRVYVASPKPEQRPPVELSVDPKLFLQKLEEARLKNERNPSPLKWNAKTKQWEDA